MFSIPRTLAVTALACLALSGCGGSGHKEPELGPLTPMPGEAEVRDPADSVLMASIQSYIAGQKGPAYSQYEYTRVDLNGDGRRDGLVLFTNPHSYWCGWGGCTMAIFQAGNDGFGVLSEFSRVRGPLIVSEHSSYGWKDIIVRVSGTARADHNVAMMHDGRSYPSDPTKEMEIAAAFSAIRGTRIFP